MRATVASIVAAALLLGGAYAEPAITSSSPYWMGDNGGVTLTVYGTDFSGDQFSQFDPTLGNVVKLVNEAETINCDVINYLTNTNKIVCVTRPRLNTASSGVFYVKVWSDGVEATGATTVQYADWVAPKIDSVSPLWAVPGDLVEFNGYMQSNKFLVLDPTNPTETGSTSGVIITKVFMGGVKCEMVNETSGELYYLADNSRSLLCLPTTKYIGPMNGTTYVNERGSSVSRKWGTYVDSQDRLFQHHTYAVVNSVSPSSGSSEGSTLLTLTGTWFDPYPGNTQVWVGGAECEIQNVEYDTLTCLTPPQDETGPASADRGILSEIWSGVYVTSLLDDAAWAGLDENHSGYSSMVQLTTSTTVEVTDSASGKLSGYFHAPHDGSYAYGTGDLNGESEFLIATDGNPDNKVRVGHWESVYMTADTPAYFELRYRTTTTSTFRIRMNDFDSKFTYAQTAMGIDEKHRVRINPAVAYEKQRISFGGSAGDAKLYLGGMLSESVTLSDGEQIRSALLGLTDQMCETQGENPSFDKEMDFEMDETIGFNPRGSTENDLDAYCGKNAFKLYKSDPRIFYIDDEAEMVDVSTHPYMCFALRGNVKSTMHVQFRWTDKNGKTDRTDGIDIEHGFTSTADTWDYRCFNLQDVVDNSWINGNRNAGAKLLLRYSRGPYPSSERDAVYVDALSFSSEEIIVVQTRPSALKNLGILISDINVVAVENEDAFDVEFITSNCFGDFPLVGVTTAAGEASWITDLADASSYTFSVNGVEVNNSREVVATHPVDGTWSLTIEGETIEGIRYQTEEWELEMMVESALGSSGMSVYRGGACERYQWDIEWNESPGQKELVSADISGLTFDGTKIDLALSKSQQGRLWHDLLHGDFFTVRGTDPAVFVRVNGYSASCLSDCSFTYDDTGVPSLTSVTGSDDGAGSHTLTIIGTGFTSSDIADYAVAVGDASCVVSAVTTTQVTCTVAYLSAGSYPVAVSMQPVGGAQQPNPSLSYSVTASVTSITPATGGTGGGYSVVVAGTGFPADLDGWEENSVTLGGADCEVTDADSTSVTCTAPAGTGVVDVTVTVGGTSASLSSGFTYDASLSAVLTSVSPTASSVLGGDLLTITGSDFGAGTDGFVMVGDEMCGIESWADASITCTLPSLDPGVHAVSVYTDSRGYASGSASVTYTLKVTSSSMATGSVYGGTILVIQGEGFGTDCSLLNVDLENGVMCDILECSDTEITCEIMMMPQTHVIRNTGVYTVHGPGYAWEPKNVKIREGDSVRWEWSKVDPISQILYNVFETDSASSTDYNNVGFNTGAPTSSGSYMVTFHHEGVITYAGDPMANNVVMTGQINVMRPSEMAYEVEVYLGGIEADYEPSGTGASVSVAGCSPILETALDDCNSTAPSAPDADHLYFITDTCFTPIISTVSASATQSISGLSGLQVAGGATLTIAGSGLGTSTCQSQVFVGESACTVTASSDTSVTCDLDDYDNMVSLKPFPLVVKVVNRGIAALEVPDFKTTGQVSIVPVVNSFSPVVGSLAGGTVITIQGTGLQAFDGQATVLLGSYPCVVSDVTPTAITCTSSPAPEGAVNIVVRISAYNIDAVSNLVSSIFTYSAAATPSVTSTALSGTTLTISGSGFGTNTASVSVVLTSSAVRRKRSISEAAPEKTAKSAIRYVVANRNAFKQEIDTEHQRDTRMPLVRSDLFDDIESETRFWGKFTKTGARTFEETKAAGAWKIGGTTRVAKQDSQIVEESRRVKRQVVATTVTCTPTSVTSTTISCTAADLPAGSYDLSVSVSGLGAASVDPAAATLSAAATVTSIIPTSGSVNGGALLTIAGNSFTPGSLTVTVDGSTCDIESEDIDTITCFTPAHVAGTVSVVVTSGGIATTSPDDFTYDTTKTPVLSTSPALPDVVCCGASLTLTGTDLKLDVDDPEVTVNGEPCTVVTATSISVTCTSPELASGTYDVVLRDALYGYSNAISVTYSFSIDSISPATGGFGGIEATLSGTGFDPAGGSTVTVCGASCEVISGGFGSITCEVPPKVAGASATEVCDVVVTNPDATTTTLALGFTYDSALTSSVTSISPERGGTGGGTRITITGTDFAASGNTVTIGDSICDIISESSTEITCDTQSHDGPGTFPVKVKVPGNGFATVDENGEFFYIDRWSSVFTWGGDPVPSEGELVVIENGQTVLMDESTEVLEMLLIKGGHVVFDQEASSEIVLRAKYILIVEGGSLSIGSEEDPFTGDAVIELYGNFQSIELPNYGAKVMAVRDGSLDLHGAYIPVTWTHLASTASAGDSSITLKQPVTWKAGDQIVIATTERRFMVNENEVRTIASVSGDGLTLTLTEALDYEHISIEQTFGSHTIETRAEVGLLTRNIKIRGNIDADFVEDIEGCAETFNPGQFETQTCFNGRYGDETITAQFGATVMLFSKTPNEDLVSGRIEYVEVTEAGQAFQLGRYPLHFHLVGNVSTSYIRGCAVHRTYNRAVTIHAADYLTVEKNVVYNNMGHAIFTEDGVEQFNVIQYNLAVYTRTSASLLNVDVTPSSYWVVHPNNIVRHNAAAGGTHFAYWYRLERHPSGPSATNAICQNNAELGEFVNNTAHSMGRYGLWVFSMDGYFPKSGECWGSNLVARWDGFTVWRCDRGAEVVFGGALQFNNFIALDNEHAGLEMVKMEGNFGLDDGPAISNSVLIGHSALTPEGCGDEASGIIAPKQYIFSIADTEFYNYDTNQCAALSGCSQCKVFQGGYQVQVAGLSFTNSPNKLKFQWEHETEWIDADGSLTGTPESKVVPDMGILPPSCTKSVPEFSINPGAPGAVCDPALQFHRLSVKGTNVSPQSFRGGDLVLSNSYGNTTIPYRVKRLDGGEGWMALVYSGGTYDWEFEDGSTHTDIKYEAKIRMLNNGDYFYIRHPFMQSLDYVSITGDEKNSSDAIPDPVTGFHGDYYWDDSDNSLTYLVSRNQASRRKREVIFDSRPSGSTRNINFNVYRCEYEGCVEPTLPPAPTGRPDNPYLWSDIETWKDVPVGSGGHPTDGVYNLPVEGDDIIIPADMWLVVDTDTPELGRVTVYGALEFDDSMDHVFSATIIFAQGGTVVAGFGEDAPFTHNLNIILRGTTDPTDPDNEAIPMPSGTPDVGWKAMGMFGPLKLHGECPTTTWVKLGATAAVGDTVVTLAATADVSWVGKEVVITATGKEPSETEVRTVVSASGSTLTLDSALTYEHLGETYTLSDGTQYVMAGEVGLLTRNIVIEGSDYAGLETEGLGGRVLVSSVTAGATEYTGIAQLSCVEFRNMGQKDFSDSTDPRFALALHTLGTDDGTSYVKKCSFNKNFNSAIGVFGSNNFLFEHNVVYHTIGSGIVDEGEDNSFRFNLVSLLYFPGTYNGQLETQYQPWEGSFYLNLASRTVLEGNVVAGSELAGYRTYGELCEDDTNWINNEVHGATYGVMVWKKAGTPKIECRRVNDFYAWRITDTAFFMHHYANLLLENVVSVDSLVGTNQLVYAPPALSHVSVPKTATTKDSLFVGASPSYDCTYHDSNSNIRVVLEALSTMWKGGVDGGNAGVMFGTFASSKNMAPKHAFHEVATYPAINGGSYITNVKFADYTTRTCGTDVAMISNKDADDAIHPVFVSGLTFLDTPEDNKLFLFEPNLGRVNPSDCVDMDCDGHKKVIITDTDGTFLGSSDATVTSIAEYEWDGDPSRGVGDYRIPIPLRQNADGTEITADEKFPNKGILRDDSCTLMSAWRGWKCTNLKHRMMVIESMDSDTEIRRLSPIALIANPGVNGCVDLLNGPMDRGWCFGYTCQERISTFYSVVATGNTYEMGMTSTPPQVIRFSLLHTDPTEAVLLRIYYPKMQRFDVSVDGVYVPPTNIDNSKYPGEYQLLPEADSFLPSIADPVGTNYLQRTKKYLHVVLRGGSVIDIKMMPTIVLSMGIVVDPNDFFEENIVQNLANLLGIPPENIRVTNVIRETPTLRRRRAATETVEMEFEIGSPPSNAANETDSAIDGTDAEILSRDDLNHIMAKAVNSFQEGTSSEFGLSVSTLKIEEPLPEAKKPTGYATEEFGSQVTGTDLFSNVQQQEEQEELTASIEGEEYQQPGDSRMLQEVPTLVKALTVFDVQPVFNVLSTDGESLESLGHASEPWMVTAELTGGNGVAQLIGETTVPYLDGGASFTNLAVSNPGTNFGMTFSVTSPAEAPSLTVSLTTSFSVEPKEVRMLAIAPEYVVAGSPFDVTVVILDQDTKDVMDSSVLVGQEMTGELKGPRKNRLSGSTSFLTSDENVATYTIEGVIISKPTKKYRITAKAQVEPAGFDMAALSNRFMVLAADIPDGSPTINVKFRVKRLRSTALAQNRNDVIAKAFAEVSKSMNVFWSNPDVQGGKKVIFSADVTGTVDNIRDALMGICNQMRRGGLRFKVAGRQVKLNSMKVGTGKWQSCKSDLIIDIEQRVLV